MTNRQRAIQSVAAHAWAAIRREADANGEQVRQATREAVRWHVEAACGNDRRAHEVNAPRFIAAVTRNVEDSAGVRRGRWS
jgi:hypothetical protein